MCAQSALDFSWMDRVQPEHGVFITAEGLLMYLQPDEALGLIAACAERFPGGRMMFDLPPAWFAKWISRGMLRPSLRYRVPPMPFSMSVVGVGKPAQRGAGHSCGARYCHCRRAAAKSSTPCCGRAHRIPLFDSVRPVTTLLEFG